MDQITNEQPVERGCTTISGVPYMLNAEGALVPAANVKAEHKLENYLVFDLLERATELADALVMFKHHAFAEIDAFVALIAKEYGVEKGGIKGNLTLKSFDGQTMVQVSMGDFITFGIELQAAKNLIDECIGKWAAGADTNLRTIVNDAFAVGKEGKLQADRILGLRRLQIDDPTWARAMEAISNAVRVTRTKRYVRFYRRPTPDADFVQVSLDMARAREG